MRPRLPLIIELEIWSRPEADLPQEAGKQIGLRCSTELGLPDGIVLGLSAIPDSTDSENLRMSIGQRELSASDFQEFCATRSLPVDPNATESAARYLAHVYGVALAWVHLPASVDGLKYGYRVHHWASSHGFCLVEPSSKYCFLEGTSLDQLLPPDA